VIDDRSVQASSGENLWFAGNGAHWEAWVSHERVIENFDLDKADMRGQIPSNWETQSAEAAWQWISGFSAAHEVFHAIGDPHTSSSPDFLMTTDPNWSWLNKPYVPITVEDDLNTWYNLLYQSIGIIAAGNG